MAAGRGNGEAGVRAIDRAVAILTAFKESDGELGITEIARRTSLATSTTQRLLIAMQQHDLVRQTPSGRYRLGGLLHALASRGSAGGGLRAAARPHLVVLRDEIDETVAVHEYLAPGQRVVLDQVESHQELRRTYTDIGIPSSVLHGAPGKAILSCLDEGIVDALLETPIARLTERTIVDPDVLRAQLRQARDDGYAQSDGERTRGIRSMAAPVLGSAGTVLGSINASVPQSRIDDARAEQIAIRVRQAAWRISMDLGATRERVASAVPGLRVG